MADKKKVGTHGTDEETGRSKVNKTKCPVTKEEFLEHAKPIVLNLGEKIGSKVAAVKEFSTGSFGWHTNDKIVVEINGKAVTVQANIGLTVVGSKELAEAK